MKIYRVDVSMNRRAVIGPVRKARQGVQSRQGP